jgi:hypothetical protein
VFCGAKKLQSRVSHLLDLEVVVGFCCGKLSHADIGFTPKNHVRRTQPVSVDQFDRHLRVARSKEPDRTAHRDIGRIHRGGDGEATRAKPLGEIDFAYEIGGAAQHRFAMAQRHFAEGGGLHPIPVEQDDAEPALDLLKASGQRGL